MAWLRVSVPARRDPKPCPHTSSSQAPQLAEACAHATSPQAHTLPSATQRETSETRFGQRFRDFPSLFTVPPRLNTCCYRQRHVWLYCTQCTAAHAESVIELVRYVSVSVSPHQDYASAPKLTRPGPQALGGRRALPSPTSLRPPRLIRALPLSEALPLQPTSPDSGRATGYCPPRPRRLLPAPRGSQALKSSHESGPAALRAAPGRSLRWVLGGRLGHVHGFWGAAYFVDRASEEHVVEAYCLPPPPTPPHPRHALEPIKAHGAGPTRHKNGGRRGPGRVE